MSRRPQFPPGKADDEVVRDASRVYSLARLSGLQRFGQHRGSEWVLAKVPPSDQQT